MKSVLAFVLFAAVVVGALVLFPGKEYPRMPDDSVHNLVQDLPSCTGCHGQGKPFELKKTHPPKYDCLKCHRKAGRS